MIVNCASALANIGGEYVPASTRNDLQQMEQNRLESVSRPKARGYLHKLASEMIDLSVTTPEGISLPHVSGIKPNHERLNRVAVRIIRGLFFHEKRYPVPEGYGVDATIRQIGFDPEEDLRVHAFFTSVPPETRRSVQNGAFVYLYWRVADERHATAWIAVFHTVPLWLIGFIRPLSRISED